ncbi:hypothetical protein GCK72_022163 [Caenorhabditis remanei]|uniref:Uncharacterized protein n=1 Tax=Caenorhabditis remanei TaxID=31234 RepID=A0A6A5FT96_CAERE|nr:hypothetical protein GCK72_022163 [Caenorhabditis remanei]KAF1745716.1 hypothetical protein GCK72_022163 [Caenorhabditis remanei]
MTSWDGLFSVSPWEKEDGFLNLRARFNLENLEKPMNLDIPEDFSFECKVFLQELRQVILELRNFPPNQSNIVTVMSVPASTVRPVLTENTYICLLKEYPHIQFDVHERISMLCVKRNLITNFILIQDIQSI